MRSFFKRTALLLTILLVVWCFIAPSCMTFRKADAEMKQKFQASGIELKTGFQLVEGRTLHYALTGSDSLPTLYFVHGTPGSWDAFESYLRDSSLLKKYRMVSIDRPGFGYSDFGKACNLSEQSDIISPLFRKLSNGKPSYIVGHSMGGPMIVKLAADNPGTFSAMVILAGSEDPAAEKKEKWRPILFKTPLNLLIPGALRPSNEELWYLKKDLVALKQDFPKIKCPVYILHGQKDQLVPVSNAAYAQKSLINASKVDIHYFPNENHFIPWTQFPFIQKLLLNLDSNSYRMDSE